MLSKQALLERIDELEAKVAMLSKENEFYKKQERDTIWVGLNSMRKNTKVSQSKSTLWVSPQDYMDEIQEEKRYEFIDKTKPKKKYLLKRTNTDTPYKCSQCETCFSSKRNLANHIEAVHEGKKPFVCANCNAKYSQKHSLILHIARKHGVKCSMCDEKFSTIQELKQHFSSFSVNSGEGGRNSFVDYDNPTSNDTSFESRLLH